MEIVPLLMKKDSSLSCKASRKALLPRLLGTDVRMRLTALQLTNSLTVSTTGHWPRICTGQLWQAGNRQLTGSLQQEYSLNWHQLAGVVLIQLDAVAVALAVICGLRCSLLKQIRFGVRHCAYNNLHMANISNGVNGSLIIQAFPWSSFFLRCFTLGCPVMLQYFQTFV